VLGATDAQVTLIPASPHTALTSENVQIAGPGGHFMFPLVPPGRYQHSVWEDGEDAGAAIFDSEFRKPFESKAQTVEVEEKKKATAQLQPISKVEK
jgi:hypothetical protein